ncbi:hypothetical protein RFI_22076 [Reticulomyxa filosa]|uniref:Uncharacterized protein n=1 Tax=Reticulomyxa filosa TaxID=46433 RepID=X6MMP9_RETFI|nr:hypothetical protein RFI_22076 [Reticulomyxa filosa]|eukprot:ETO15288.1 hypothetical protein RFI_22076 [Reticulomyxa filosa]
MKHLVILVFEKGKIFFILKKVRCKLKNFVTICFPPKKKRKTQYQIIGENFFVETSKVKFHELEIIIKQQFQVFNVIPKILEVFLSKQKIFKSKTNLKKICSLLKILLIVHFFLKYFQEHSTFLQMIYHFQTLDKKPKIGHESIVSIYFSIILEWRDVHYISSNCKYLSTFFFFVQKGVETRQLVGVGGQTCQQGEAGPSISADPVSSPVLANKKWWQWEVQ